MNWNFTVGRWGLMSTPRKCLLALLRKQLAPRGSSSCQAKMSKIRKYFFLIRLHLIFFYALLYTANSEIFARNPDL